MSDKRTLIVQIRTRNGSEYELREWESVFQRVLDLPPPTSLLPDGLFPVAVILDDLGDVDPKQARAIIKEATATLLATIQYVQACLERRIQELTDTFLDLVNQAPVIMMRAAKDRVWVNIRSHAKMLLEIQEFIASVEAQG